MKNFIVRLGTRLHPFVLWFYMIPILLMAVNARHLFYPMNSHFFDETVEISGLLIAAAGACLRLWTSGTSPRTFVPHGARGRPLYRYWEGGAYSIMRYPYFSADFLIVLGLSLPLIDYGWVLLSVGLFAVLYAPILYSREVTLGREHPETYSNFRRQVSLLVPAWKNFRRPKARFRLPYALSREGNVFGIIGLLMLFIEQFREVAITGTLDFDPLWAFVVLPFLAFWLAIRSFDRHVEELPGAADLVD